MQEPLFGDYHIPNDTQRVARTAFPKGNLSMQVRDRFGMLYDNHHFAHLFADAGQPALAPARLALVLIFQFLEDLSDRAAADAVRDRISWKYALGLSLDDPGFHYSVLSEFRQRLLPGDAEQLRLDAVLNLCREVGSGTLWVKARSKQRTDSTSVLATIRELSRLENVGEALRHALNQLAVEAPAWLRSHADPTWVERYGPRITEYRLPQAEVERQAMALTIGQDGYRLLEAVYDSATPTRLRDLPAAPKGYPTLRQIWVQQLYRCDNPAAPVVRWRTKEEQPPSAQIISSPYDPEARFIIKS